LCVEEGANMKPSVEIDASEFLKAMEKAEFTNQEVMDILGAGAAVVKTTQKLLVPVDTGATRASIIEHFGENEVDIGPSTEYAPYIEYGTSNPNYPVQPFVVPSATGRSKDQAIRSMQIAIKATLLGKGLL
jgi:HK97 gp10 family phage protein